MCIRDRAGGIFIAARGAAVDGHSFIPQAAAQKALGVVCEKAPSGSEIPGDFPYILVEDSFQALKDIAEYYRSQLDLPVIGITECGKNQHQGIHRRRAFGEIPGIKNRREF